MGYILQQQKNYLCSQKENVMNDISSIAHRIEELTKEINRHNYNYYMMDNPTIPDYEFDKLLAELIELEREHPELKRPDSPTQRVGGEVNKRFESAAHIYPMQSLGNTYSREDLIEFDRRVREFLPEQYSMYVS